MPITRRYVPWKEKHKAPMGFGTHCPDMTEQQAQELLDRAVEDPDHDSHSEALFMVDGDWCFEAHRHTDGSYHGFPRPGLEFDERVLRTLRDLGWITKGQMNRLRRQKQLPERYP
jgi:hypothetical protein